jgi:hypothetical protein
MESFHEKKLFCHLQKLMKAAVVSVLNKMRRLYHTGSNTKKPNQPTNADRAKNSMKQDYLFMRIIE